MCERSHLQLRRQGSNRAFLGTVWGVGWQVCWLGLVGWSSSNGLVGSFYEKAADYKDWHFLENSTIVDIWNVCIIHIKHMYVYIYTYDYIWSYVPWLEKDGKKPLELLVDSSFICVYGDFCYFFFPCPKQSHPKSHPVCLPKNGAWDPDSPAATSQIIEPIYRQFFHTVDGSEILHLGM